MGVRDPWRYPEFLCVCERPVEISRIYVWMYETRGVGRKVLLPERENTRSWLSRRLIVG